MAMNIARQSDAVPFDPPGHRDVSPVRLRDNPDESVSVILSHYQPGGEAELNPQPAETVYVVLAGELVMISEGREETLRPYDSAHFTTGDKRQVINRTDQPATLLVLRPATR